MGAGVDLTILIADDDEGHVYLVRRNLERVGITNDFLHFTNGEALLDFLYMRGDGPHREAGRPYLLLLDIRMPRVDGIEVLRTIKQDPTLKLLPVIMLTTTDSPGEIALCHELGCSSYLTKSVNYEEFVDKIHNLGLFLRIAHMPTLQEDDLRSLEV